VVEAEETSRKLNVWIETSTHVWEQYSTSE
jgi:hypothetical protein